MKMPFLDRDNARIESKRIEPRMYLARTPFYAPILFWYLSLVAFIWEMWK